jgi:hypothetical protein
MYRENSLGSKIISAIRKERMSQEQSSKSPQDLIRETYNQKLTEKAAAARVEVLEQHLFQPSNITFQDFFRVMIDESQKITGTQGEKSNGITVPRLSKGRILQEDSQIVADLKHLRRKISQEDRRDNAEVKVSFLTSIIQFMEAHISNQETNKSTVTRTQDHVRLTIRRVIDDQIEIMRKQSREELGKITPKTRFPISGVFVSRSKRLTELDHFLSRLLDNAQSEIEVVRNNLEKSPHVRLDYLSEYVQEIENRGLDASLKALAVQREYVLGVLEKNKKVKDAATGSSPESPDPSSQNSLHDQEKSEQPLDS